jgi:hypothetical protein
MSTTALYGAMHHGSGAGRGKKFSFLIPYLGANWDVNNDSVAVRSISRFAYRDCSDVKDRIM